MTWSCLNCFLTSAGSLLISTLFKFIKIFLKFFCTILGVQNKFTTINSPNQAIQPEVVGPLFTKKGDRVKVYLDFWIWSGTPGPGCVGPTLVGPTHSESYDAQIFRASFFIRIAGPTTKSS